MGHNRCIESGSCPCAQSNLGKEREWADSWWTHVELAQLVPQWFYRSRLPSGTTVASSRFVRSVPRRRTASQKAPRRGCRGVDRRLGRREVAQRRYRARSHSCCALPSVASREDGRASRPKSERPLCKPARTPVLVLRQRRKRSSRRASSFAFDCRCPSHDITDKARMIDEGTMYDRS